MLGAEQKSWLLGRLRTSPAAWKLWGNSVAMLDVRIDTQRLPPRQGFPAWPVDGYGQIGDDDWSAYIHERAEIFDVLKRERITGVVTLCGDRHAFQTGLLSTALPPNRFEPVAAEFVTGSVSAPGLAEAAEYVVGPQHPLRPLPPAQLPRCAFMWTIRVFFPRIAII